MKKARILIFFLIALVIFSAGCGVKIIPKTGQEGIIDSTHNIITKEKNGIKITARSMDWRFDPYFLEEYFTPIFLIIKNDTEQKINISYKNFTAFDDLGNQYNAIPPANVNDSLLAGEYYPFYPYYPYYPYTETTIIREKEGIYTTFGFGIPFLYSYRRSFGNITLYALPEGEIHSHAQVRGFVYFTRADQYGKELRLKLKIDSIEQEFEFILKK